MDWKLYSLFAIVIAVSSVAGFFIAKNIYSKTIVTQQTEKEIWKYDTTYVTKIENIGRVDTIYVKDEFGKDSVENIIARLDTTFLQDKDTFKLGIKYYYLPINKFEYELDYKKSLKEIYHIDTVTVTVKEPESFWSKFGFSIGAGILTDEKFNISRGLFLGISYKILGN